MKKNLHNLQQVHAFCFASLFIMSRPLRCDLLRHIYRSLYLFTSSDVLSTHSKIQKTSDSSSFTSCFLMSHWISHLPYTSCKIKSCNPEQLHTEGHCMWWLPYKQTLSLCKYTCLLLAKGNMLFIFSGFIRIKHAFFISHRSF